MESFHDDIIEYRKQMEKGVINKAYKGLMEYILNLRTYFRAVPDLIYAKNRLHWIA